MTVPNDKQRIQITLLKATLAKIVKDAAKRKVPPATRASEIVEDHYTDDDKVVNNG